jgi:hypothetical protein
VEGTGKMARDAPVMIRKLSACLKSISTTLIYSLAAAFHPTGMLLADAG